MSFLVMGVAIFAVLATGTMVAMRHCQAKPVRVLARRRYKR